MKTVPKEEGHYIAELHDVDNCKWVVCGVLKNEDIEEPLGSKKFRKTCHVRGAPSRI